MKERLPAATRVACFEKGVDKGYPIQQSFPKINGIILTNELYNN